MVTHLRVQGVLAGVRLSYRYCGRAYFSNGENPTRMKIFYGKKYAGYKRLIRT